MLTDLVIGLILILCTSSIMQNETWICATLYSVASHIIKIHDVYETCPVTRLADSGPQSLHVADSFAAECLEETPVKNA